MKFNKKDMRFHSKSLIWNRAYRWVLPVLLMVTTGWAAQFDSTTASSEGEVPHRLGVMSCDLTITNVTAIDETCPGTNDGTLTATATCASCAGGNADIRYSIDNIDFSNITGVFTGLSANTYTVYVRDVNDNNCIDSSGLNTLGADGEAPIPDAFICCEWAEAAKALASDGAEQDEFGYSVSINGDYAIVGAYKDDDNGNNSGSAYIFQRSGSNWTQHAKLTADDGAELDEFGVAVSISGDYAIVGAHRNDWNGNRSGSAYIFQRTGNNWVQQAKLTADDAMGFEGFGISVSISGDYVVVGAFRDNENGFSSGAAYVFQRSGNTWIQQSKLIADDGADDAEFGVSVSISGDYIIAGAWGDDVNGSGSGSAYIFHRSGSTWAQQAKLTANDVDEQDVFGASVSISGDYAIIGAYLDDDDGTDSGSAYIFQRTGSNWVQQVKLTADDAAAFDFFGYAVSISGDYAMVGAWGDDENGSNSGSAYIFERDGSIWTQKPRLTASDGQAVELFGHSVSIHGEDAIVGANFDKDNGSASGSAYFFELGPGDLPAFTAGCSATPPTPTATDGCAGTINGTTTASFPITDQGITTITWTYDDGNGNITIQEQDIIVEDVTPPVVICPGTNPTVYLDCSGIGTLAANALAAGNSTDECSAVLMETSPLTSFTCDDLPVATVVLTAMDNSGNTSTANCTIHIVDSVAPKFDGTSGGWSEMAKALAMDGAADDRFGLSVSIDGDYAIVGAYWDDDNGDKSGSAYVFVRNGNAWTQQAKLTASDGAADDHFGRSVSISGDYILVGAQFDDDNSNNSGSAYIFHRSGSSWSEQAKLLASDGDADDYFGTSVSISGDYAIVGSLADDDDGNNSGSAYIFLRSGSSWLQQQKLTASDGAAGDLFGANVSISGDYVVISAYHDDDNGYNSGSVYVFHRGGSSWFEQAKLTASDGVADDDFGLSVNINGSYCIVGTTSVNANMGAAYIFYRSGSSWSEQAKLIASDGAAGDNMGVTVSIDGEYAIVGASKNSGDNGNSSGSAYIFQLSGNCWIEQEKLTASDGAAFDEFGRSVSLSGNYAIVGAFADDDNGSNSGSAYLFELKPTILPPFMAECSGTPPTPTGTDNCAGTIQATTTNSFPISTPGITTIVWSCDDGNGNMTTLEQDIIIDNSNCCVIAVTNVTTTGETCPGDNNGTLTATATCSTCAGGNADIRYSIDNSDFSNSTGIFTGLASGDYTVYVRDVNDIGCADDDGYHVVALGQDTEAPVPDIATGSSWAEAAKVLANDGAAGDNFGFSVSISGDYAIVGAYRDADEGNNTGAAYIFHRSGSGWAQQVKLTAYDAAAGDGFGISVAISGDYAIVGADNDDDNGNSSGSAYIFLRSGNTWQAQAKLKADDAAAADFFGRSVAISGDYAIIGANGDDDNGNSSGSAYIFHRSGNSWTEQAKLIASGGGANDEFGRSVSISGDYAIVGAWRNTSTAVEAGAAYIFQRSGASWTQQTKLTANDIGANDRFGVSVAINGDYAIVGAYWNDDNGSDSGSAYIYHLSGSTWMQQAKLTANDAVSNARFGISVAISGYHAQIGAYWDNQNGSFSGSAYIFQRNGSSWMQQSKLSADDASPGDEFGISVSISGDYAIVGAFGDDDNGSDSGSAYFFGQGAGDLPAFTAECSATPPTPTATDNCAGTINGTTTATFPITTPGTTTIIWIYDDGNGNITTQEQDITVIPCISLTGTIRWEHDNAGVEAATVDLTGDATDSTLTNVDGEYDFEIVPGSYNLVPSKEDGLLNGVSVADVVAIQQHVTLVNPITDPYKLIAADVNQSNSITTLDALIVAQTILGNPVAEALFLNSWRFVDADYVFPNPASPWSFPSSISLVDVNENTPAQDFVGVKMGDVNGSAMPNSNFWDDSWANRNDEVPVLVWQVEDQPLYTIGDELELTFKAGDLNELIAYQFGLGFSRSHLELLEVIPHEALGLETNHFGTHLADAGELRGLWWEEEEGLSHSLAPGTPVFTLRFRVLRRADHLKDHLWLDETILKDEAYRADRMRGRVVLEFAEQVVSAFDAAASGQIKLYQNIPNPFSEVTRIGFELPEAAEVKLRITDVSGREIQLIEGRFAAGYNEVEVRNLPARGLFFYQLQTEGFTATLKMVRE